MRAVGGAIRDPFRIVEWSGGVSPGYNSLAGKVLRSSPRLVAGERTAVFILAGQSNSANFMDVQYTPTHASKIDNLNIYDGGVYAATDPLLGCEKYTDIVNPGCMFLRMADKVIADGLWDRVILIPTGIGGSSVAVWNSLPFADRLLVAFQRAEALGYPATAVLWQQGEADQATSQVAYSSALQTVIARPRSKGFDAPWLIALCTYFLGVTSEPVRQAQFNIRNGVDILAGPDTDTITSGGRHDNGHFNATGGDQAAALWSSALSVLAP